MFVLCFGHEGRGGFGVSRGYGEVGEGHNRSGGARGGVRCCVGESLAVVGEVSLWGWRRSGLHQSSAERLALRVSVGEELDFQGGVRFRGWRRSG